MEKDVTKLDQQDITGKDVEGNPIGPDLVSASAESPVLPGSEETPLDESTPASPEEPAAPEVDWEKRFGDQRRSYQTLKAEKDALAAKAKTAEDLEKRFKRYEAHNIDFAEIDRAIDAMGPSDAPSATPTTPSQPSGDFVSRDEFNNAVMQAHYQTARMVFQDSHPEFKDSELAQLLDTYVGQEVMRERQEYDRVVSQPHELLATAGKRVNALTNRFKEEGVKTVTEKRVKIKEAAVPESGKPPAQPAAIEEEPGYSPGDYARDIREQREKIRQPVLP